MPAEELGPDPVRVAADALAAPADDGPADHVAGRLVPVGGDAADDGVVLRVAGRVDLAVEQRADERVEGEVDRVDRFEDDQRVPRDRRMDVMGVQPLHRLGRADDRRRRLAELDGQRIDDLDLGVGEPDQHRRQLGDRGGTRLQADAVAALARVVQLELVVLGDDLLGQEGGRRRLRGRVGCGGIGIALCASGNRAARGAPRRAGVDPAVMVAGAPSPPVSGPPRGSMPRPARGRSRRRTASGASRRRSGAGPEPRLPAASGSGRPAGATPPASRPTFRRRGRSRPLPSDGTRRCRRRPSGSSVRCADLERRRGGSQRDQASVQRQDRVRIGASAPRRSASRCRTRAAATDGRS